MFFTSFIALWIILLKSISKCVIFSSARSLSNNGTKCLLLMIVINWTWIRSQLSIISKITLFAKSQWYFIVLTFWSHKAISLNLLITNWHLLFHLCQMWWFWKLLSCSKCIFSWCVLVFLNWSGAILCWRWRTTPNKINFIVRVPRHASLASHWKLGHVWSTRIGFVATD